MPFTNSCFISYRHTEIARNRAIIEQTVDALKAELELRVPLPVYIDKDRLKGGSFYNEALATSLCSSVCMVMLYWPNYFSVDHTFCSREFKKMEELERARLLLLPNPVDRQRGLIIPVAFRDFDQIPPEVRDTRLVYNFEAHSLRRNMGQKQEFLQDIFQIGTYITERFRIFQRLPPPDPCNDCAQCKLPSSEDVLPWVQSIVRGIPAVPYPTREAGR